MSNEVVKYHNDLNTVDLKGWTKEDMNLFFAIIAKLRDHTHEEEVTFSKNELLKYTGYSQKSNKRLISITAGLVEKIKRIEYIERTSKSITWMSLFTKARIEWNDNGDDFTATFRISEDFEYILNKLDANFTKFELAEFVKLKSVYAKQAYRVLKQWKTVGVRKFDLDEFKYVFSVPESYSISDITKHVLEPIKKELPQYFGKLTIKVNKAKTRGTPVIGYEFKWKPEKTAGPYEPGKPKTKKPGKPAALPEWYYRDDPGQAEASQIAELEALLARQPKAAAQPEEAAAPLDDLEKDIFGYE